MSYVHSRPSGLGDSIGAGGIRSLSVAVGVFALIALTALLAGSPVDAPDARSAEAASRSAPESDGGREFDGRGKWGGYAR